MTEYKVLGATFNGTVVDLKHQSRGGTVIHRRFCITYVQLSQLCLFAGVGLLQPINIMDIDNQPYPRFHDEDLRLNNVSRITSDI